MFSKERFMSISHTITPADYDIIVTLIEERNYHTSQLIRGAERQIDICETVLRSHSPQVIRTEDEEVEINMDNVDDYLTQGYTILVGTVVYAILHGQETTLGESLLRRIDDDVIDVYKSQTGIEPANAKGNNTYKKYKFKRW